jgi:hypothetical protein
MGSLIGCPAKSTNALSSFKALILIVWSAAFEVSKTAPSPPFTVFDPS